MLTENENEESLQAGKHCVVQIMFDIQSEAEEVFGAFLKSEDFRRIHSSKVIAESSESAAAVFLAHCPLVHMQMAIASGRRRVYEIGPAFTAEHLNTHNELVCIDVEMEIRRHYVEVMDIVDRLFVTVFDHLNENCKEKLEAIHSQYPFEPLKYLPKTLRLTFEEGLQMLKEAGVEVDPYGDLNTEAKRKLGQLVLQKYGTEFYILHRYPLAVRPFYTMPSYDDANYSNSFDVFMRGEEILSGGQHIHIVEMLEERAKKCGIDLNTITTYIEYFRYGMPLHGGFQMGLERIISLFCSL